MTQRTVGTHKRSFAARRRTNDKGRKDTIVVWQRPNIWLIAWAACTVLFLTGLAGDKSKVLFVLGTVSLAVWAILELFRGVNLLRKVLGGVVLLILLGVSRHILSVITG